MNPLGKGLESLIPDKDPLELSDKEPLDILDAQANIPEPVYRLASLGGATVPRADFGTSAHNEIKAEVAKTMLALAPSQENFHEEVPRYARSRGESVFWIDIGKIEPNPYQPRKEFDEEALKSLSDSIRTHGVLQPIVVYKVEVETPRGLDVRYQLIAGERRWRASKMAGLREVPAMVKRGQAEERQKLEWAIIENVQREDLSPVERARAFKQLIGEFNLSQRDVAGRIGKSREYVANAIRLLSLPVHIQTAIESGTISEGHARAILTMQGLPESQNKLFEEIKANSLTVRDAELATRAMLGARRPTKRRNASFLDPEVRSVQSRLEETLGTKVLLQKDGERGKIIVEFYSDEELRSIISKMMSGE
ncbi:MAG: ParB/RepB/Spo0J family partition protein [bacterium]|nr:ParB/RepB/Spo0J family partition protein [bacterium]